MTQPAAFHSDGSRTAAAEVEKWRLLSTVAAGEDPLVASQLAATRQSSIRRSASTRVDGSAVDAHSGRQS